ncbi:MAG: YebC/PmpR family DNA-binding transcriptional regulator [Candidatus Taylorbacteria bacterium]|nr:YebC/PmpR family DNA-binding transcriptional regulator [Candidatus Taylorbacteria bacterium]
MSGHSRWSQIKHKKGLTDKKRGQLFSKLSKLISLAARKGTNPENNLELKNAVEKARAMNMPNDNIRRAIKKVSDKSGAQLEELSIEAIGPGGIALKIKAITDNRNRTIAEIKNILADNSSKMVQPGSISWMFNQSVSITDAGIQTKIDKLLEVLDDNDDVEDVTSNLQE